MKKGIKNVKVMVFSFALAGAVLTGCGENKESAQNTSKEAHESIQQNTVENAEERDEVKEAESEEVKETEVKEDVAEEEEIKNAGAEEDKMETAEQSTETYEDNFAVDNEAAKEFAQKVKEATANKDLEALAALTAFPVYVGLPDVDIVEKREDFLGLGAENIFTDELVKSVENANIDDFEPCMAGFSISDGGTCNINFGVVDGILAVNGINY